MSTDPESLERLMADVGRTVANGIGGEYEPPCGACGFLPCECRTISLRTIPALFRPASLSEPRMADWVTGWDRVRPLFERGVPNKVVLVGPSGAGKTTLLSALVRHRADAGGLARFVEAWTLVGIGVDLEQAVRDAKACSALALDDIGNEPATQASRVREVLDARYARARTLWASTAYGPDELGRRRGDDVSRRVFEGALVVEMGAAR